MLKIRVTPRLTTGLFSFGVVIPALFAQFSQPQPLIQLLGTNIVPVEAVDTGGTTQHFLDLYGLRSHDVVNIVSTRADLCSLLLSFEVRTGDPVDCQEVVSTWLYSDVRSRTQGIVPKASIKGASIVRVLPGPRLVHTYFEPESGVFREVPSYSFDMTGHFGIDGLRTLHFGATADSAFPVDSTTYVLNEEFNLDWGDVLNGAPMDVTPIRVALQDAERSNAAAMLGLFPDELYTEVNGSAPPSANKHCGNMNDCPVSERQHCTGAPQYDCFGPTPTDPCGATALDFAALTSGTSVDVPFGQLWDFRDTFLDSHEAGQQYIRDYYFFSSFMETDLTTLLHFVSLIPLASDSIDVLMNGQDSEIVVSSDLVTEALGIINHHRDIQNGALQRTLDRVEADLLASVDLTRAEFMEAFFE